MKKLLILAGLCLLTIISGCSTDSPLDPAVPDTVDGSIYQRPEFIDTRPAEVQEQFTLRAKDAYPVAMVTPDKAGKFALVIGISDYDGTANDLQYCDDDAVDWRDRLQTEGYQVTTLIDGAATRTAIEAAIADLVSLSTAGSEIAFVYSGHGSRGNIISSDLTYINFTWFGAMFEGVGSTKMIFSFDACQIGEFAGALDANGRVIAVASDRRRYSYDGTADMQNGVFTYFQMVGFDQMGFIYFEDDSQYAVDEMYLWAKSVHVKVAPSYLDSYAGDLDL